MERVRAQKRVETVAVNRRRQRINAAGQSFRGHENIWNRAERVDAPYFAAASESALHFVGNHQRADTVTQRAHTAKIILVRHDDAHRRGNGFK